MKQLWLQLSFKPYRIAHTLLTDVKIMAVKGLSAKDIFPKSQFNVSLTNKPLH